MNEFQLDEDTRSALIAMGWTDDELAEIERASAKTISGFFGC